MAHDPADAALVRLRALAFQHPQKFMQTKLWIQDKDGNRVLLRPTWSQLQYEKVVQEMEAEGFPFESSLLKGVRSVSPLGDAVESTLALVV